MIGLQFFDVATNLAIMVGFTLITIIVGIKSFERMRS